MLVCTVHYANTANVLVVKTVLYYLLMKFAYLFVWFILSYAPVYTRYAINLEQA